MSFVSVEEAAKAVAAGRFVIICDDEGRENEGDLMIAAEFADADAVNFCTIHGRGLICCAVEPAIADRLGLQLMVPQKDNRSGFGTAFTVSVEAREGVTTGISAADRARTIEVLCDPKSTPEDLVSPGHMFPLRAHPEGTLGRGGQTEASVDLARIAGCRPAGVICEVMNEDGTMARRDDLMKVAAKHDIPMVTVEAIKAYRKAKKVEAA
ncbi:3,4-Dihydroy-2-butanone 4-phosphate synthase/GTP cyclohydrolase II [Parvularcula bermudensis HTCC2503]|uniref:3,4-dihydroxy-2-butanone 4-phosphate synthase n=1 Tax=Parvularcula bermudensis (strain ATCC BAA-594 / HTCC2503 / KCTC 12087) TaxID=314260 RepID=E0TCM5_PARBH|nr:3,4-dihydroxy-2-butanone-4-phosphate synthase [Parvularcula bermudensis]ADM08614.1 3,4-Dihydroy-2-butanone 4-phosphate synthase/GTP cyclohydrolase II [Parvularcula bermudensis HTCC2503]